jgi:prepilin signal peptidase PulO-like enzyme (type II secretory pathway)
MLPFVLYLTASSLCYSASRSAWLRRMPEERWFWLVFSGVLVCSAVARPLDLQVLITDALRSGVVGSPLYEHRRIYQASFLIGAAAAGLTVTLWVAFRSRKNHASLQVATAAMTFLLLLVLSRGTSFHGLDLLFQQRVFDLGFARLLELAGLLAVCMAAAWYLHQVKRT